LLVCSGKCVDLTSNSYNCGSCGSACKSGYVCSSSKCSLTCQTGLTNCSGTCVNLTSDTYNCGACANKCLAGYVCTSSKCTLTCQTGLTNCSGKCVDTNSDPQNCGKCGSKCASGQVCYLGACATICKPGQTNCSGTCVDLLTNVKNCGSCGNACAGSKAKCSSGLCLSDKYGNGTDGAVTTTGTVTINTIASPATGTAGSSSLSLTKPTGFKAGQAIFIHQSQGSGAGKWELNIVKSITSGVVTTNKALVNTYTTSGKDRAQAVVMPNYSTLVVPSGSTLTAPVWNGSTGGILALQASTSVTVSGSISMAERGYRGPAWPGKNYTAAVQGEGTIGLGAKSTAANGNGGGGGGRTNCECCWAGGGGGGGHGASGSKGSNAGGCQIGGSGAPAAGTTSLTTFLFGGAGGAGGADEDGYGAAGGHGGGLIYIATPKTTVTGYVSTNGRKGNNEYNFAGCGSGGGGGGAGGAVFFESASGSLTSNRVTALGGAGGNHPSNCGQPGGAGAVGRIHLAGGISGTTNPAAK